MIFFFLSFRFFLSFKMNDFLLLVKISNHLKLSSNDNEYPFNCWIHGVDVWQKGGHRRVLTFRCLEKDLLNRRITTIFRPLQSLHLANLLTTSTSLAASCRVERINGGVVYLRLFVPTSSNFIPQTSSLNHLVYLD